MSKKICSFLISATLLLFAGTSSFSQELSPSATVSAYYYALMNGKFKKAAEYVSKRMRGNKTKDEWADEWKRTFAAGKVVILEITVSAGEIKGDKATVQIKTRSKDRFNTQGIEENEIDYLVKEDGLWKIDRTEVIVAPY